MTKILLSMDEHCSPSILEAFLKEKAVRWIASIPCTIRSLSGGDQRWHGTGSLARQSCLSCQWCVAPCSWRSASYSVSRKSSSRPCLPKPAWHKEKSQYLHRRKTSIRIKNAAKMCGRRNSWEVLINNIHTFFIDNVRKEIILRNLVKQHW